MNTQIEKSAVLEELRAMVARDLAALVDSQKAAQDGAVHEETRQEHPKDTRAIEAQYLARGLAERAERLRDTATVLAALSPAEFVPDAEIAVGALVELEFDDEDAVYFIVPAAGGERIEMSGVSIRTITPGSPLGSALIGQKADDSVEVTLPGGRREATIVWVR